MFYEIDLRMFKNVYKNSTIILQIGSCVLYYMVWQHMYFYDYLTLHF
jgi:hypothetical protein